MKKTYFLIFVLVMISCRSQKKDVHTGQVDSLKITQSQEVKDTLRNPGHYYYFADIDPKIFAKWILKDSIRPSDNYSTFRVMDSLEASAFEDRKFYFNVFLKISDDADGALAEAVGLPALIYIENHTSEFLQLSSTVKKEQFDSWAHTVGIEILLSSQEDPMKDAQLFYDNLKAKCIECSDEQKVLLENFNAIMIKGIAENQE
ncbi:MAG: hypothetical protein JXB49_36845 [Bacteroidales bacterium]|nr:hypothetical protein [Bacteroidales bacterium]